LHGYLLLIALPELYNIQRDQLFFRQRHAFAHLRSIRRPIAQVILGLAIILCISSAQRYFARTPVVDQSNGHACPSPNCLGEGNRRYSSLDANMGEDASQRAWHEQ
jgi:hypothetical protein